MRTLYLGCGGLTLVIKSDDLVPLTPKPVSVHGPELVQSISHLRSLPSSRYTQWKISIDFSILDTLYLLDAGEKVEAYLGNISAYYK
jgi:hypothetical protein